MLKNSFDRSAQVKRIAVATCSGALTEFIQHLLRHWKFEIDDGTDPDVLLLAEEGCASPGKEQSVIWMSRQQEPTPDLLCLPLEIETFWKTLERQFHQPPRMHIRLDVTMEALVTVGHEMDVVAVSSLSDMGARFIYHRELVRDEALIFTVNIDGVDLPIDGRVIYAMHQSAASGEVFRAGLLFEGIKKEQRDLLRSFLIWRYLEQTQRQMTDDRFAEALEFIDLPVQVRAKLAI